MEFGTRTIQLTKYPFSLIDPHLGVECVIIVVADKSRRPGHWHGRVSP
jgi:hypothetical protein